MTRRIRRLTTGTARWTAGMMRLVGGACVAAGLFVGVLALVAPDRIEAGYGAVKTTVDGAVSAARAIVFDDLPRVPLGATGGVPELNRCDGTFTQIVSYERADIPPVWAAHNNCHGDVVLSWSVGDRVVLTTPQGDAVYEVVEVRDVDKTWSSTDDLVGLGGALALQTCYYGKPVMVFVGLTPVVH